MTKEVRGGVWGVLLAGGIGSRFWPVSTPQNPKQLLPLAGERPLVRDAVERMYGVVDADHIRILTRAAIADPILAAIPGLGPEHLWVEPRPAGTGPALAWAAARIAANDPEAVMVSTHADAAVGDEPGFRARIGEAIAAAREHRALMTIGVTPDRPETGYGYIEVGDPLGDGPARRVSSFREKPDAETAARFLASGRHAWNTGIFVWRVADFLEEIEAVCPELGRALHHAHSDDVEAFFREVQPISVDEGVLERSRRVGVLPGSFGWDDVGSWGALFRSRPVDSAGNVSVGRARVVDGRDNAAYAEQGRIVIFGADNLIVVRTGDTTLVTTRERAADLKYLLERLENDD